MLLFNEFISLSSLFFAESKSLARKSQGVNAKHDQVGLDALLNAYPGQISLQQCDFVLKCEKACHL